LLDIIDMDPLSDVLSLLDARSVISARLVAGGNWCIQSPRYEGVRFGVVATGSCDLSLHGGHGPTRLEAGDSYLLTGGLSYRIGSDVGLQAVEMDDVLAKIANGVAYCGDGADTVLLGGRFEMDAANSAFLLDELPPLIHIAAGSKASEIQRWILERLADELVEQHPGTSAMIDQLAHIMVVHILRQYLASGALPRGWLAATADPKIGKVLARIHGAPLQTWNLDALADIAGMSRSAFSARFSRLVGTSPLDYVLRWKMRLAARSLRQTVAPISTIAYAHGYESEAAFSNAFKRVVGRAPRDFRRSAASNSSA